MLSVQLFPQEALQRLCSFSSVTRSVLSYLHSETVRLFSGDQALGLGGQMFWVSVQASFITHRWQRSQGFHFSLLLFELHILVQGSWTSRAGAVCSEMSSSLFAMAVRSLEYMSAYEAWGSAQPAIRKGNRWGRAAARTPGSQVAQAGETGKAFSLAPFYPFP